MSSSIGAPRRPGYRCLGRGLWRGLALALAAGLIATLATGCSPLTRYKVLTFFFTGVPPYGEEEKPEDEVVVKPVEVKKRGGQGRSIVVKATRYSHGPYDANQCYLCHQTSGSGGYRGFGKNKEVKASIKVTTGVSGKLVVPLEKLCVGCHTDKSPARAEADGLWLHGPVATGVCTLCHGPHAGIERYLLAKKAARVCIECHAEGLIHNRAVHKDQPDCLTCHNAHLGKDSRLLKADYQELW